MEAIILEYSIQLISTCDQDPTTRRLSPVPSHYRQHRFLQRNLVPAFSGMVPALSLPRACRQPHGDPAPLAIGLEPALIPLGSFTQWYEDKVLLISRLASATNSAGLHGQPTGSQPCLLMTQPDLSVCPQQSFLPKRRTHTIHIGIITRGYSFGDIGAHRSILLGLIGHLLQKAISTRSGNIIDSPNTQK